MFSLFSLFNWAMIFWVVAIAQPFSRVNANPVTAKDLASEIENIAPEKNHKVTSDSDKLEKQAAVPPPNETCNFPSDDSPLAPPLISLGKLNVAGQTILLQVSNSTFLTEKILDKEKSVTGVFQDNRNKPLTKTDFIRIYRDIARSLTQIYLDNGYITSKAVAQETLEIPPNGVVTIPVIEGRLKDIVISGRGRISQNYLCDRLGLAVGFPLNIIQVEEQLRLLKQNPLFEGVNGNLKESGTPGLSVLQVAIQESKPFSTNLSFDNYSPISLGSERMGIGLNYQNPTGLGDNLSASYYRSTTGGMNLAEFDYRVPLNPMEGTLQLRVIPTWTRVTQAPFDQFDITGTNPLYEISYRQPLMRNLQEEFALSLGFRYQTGETLGLGRPDLFGNTQTSVIQFGQDYLKRDPDGLWFLRSQLNFGSGTQDNNPLLSGNFFSWLIQVQRLQRLTADQLLVIQGDLQLTPDTLLSDYLFIMGGGQSLRGYRQNVRSADNGFRFSIEDKITLIRDDNDTSIFEISPFIDMGSVWNSAGNPTQLPPQTFLMGTGLGLTWNNAFSLKGLAIRFDYGYPIIRLKDKGNNLQDDGIYFQISYRL